MRGNQAIAEILKREGVEFVFCFPFTPILDALAEAGIRPIVARQERVAENMADAFSRTTNGRRIGVVTVQQSAGLENGFAGIAQAYTDSSPVLFLPGHPGSQLVGVPPTFDGTANFSGATKWCDLIPSARAVAGRMRRAFTQLRSGRPRPVMLEVPVDVAFQELDRELDYEPVEAVRFGADPEAIKRAVDELLAAESPMIWAGQGVLYAEASAELTELAELLGIPVMTTLMGKSAFDERHPLALGTGGFSLTALAYDEIRRADVILALGASLARDFTAPKIPAGKKIIHNTVDATDLNVAFSPVASLLGDARLVLRALLAELRARDVATVDGTATTERLRAARDEWKAFWKPKLTSSETPINPYRVIGDFMKTFDPDETIVTHDSGNPRDQLVAQYEATVPRSYLGWGHSTQLGFGMGAAMGAKLARPEKHVAHFLGDAALGMVGMDIETAVRECIPIITVLLNNSAMGNYEKNIPIASEKYRTKYLSGNYSEVARGLGAYSERIEDPDAVVAAFERAREVTAGGQPVVLEFITAEEAAIPYAPWHEERRAESSSAG